MSILPTLGRIVYVRVANFQQVGPDQAAIVTHVDGNGTIDATVFPSGQDPIPFTGLVYFQPDVVPNGTGSSWRWPQLQQQPAA